MTLWQFLGTQGLLFFIFIFSALITGGGAETASNITMNLLTFGTSSWIITKILNNYQKGLPVWSSVLTTTLSFNLVTYLLAYASHTPLPAFSSIIIDFFMVSVFSCLGIFLGLRGPRQKTDS